MFDDLRIRNKLILLVAVPIVIVVVLAAIGARSRTDTAATSRQTQDLVSLARSGSDLINSLQQESLYSAAYVASGRTQWKPEVDAARNQTNAALADASGRLDELMGTSANFRSSAALARGASEKLQYIRSATDEGYRWDQVADTYSLLQDTFLGLNVSITDALTDPQVAGQLRAAGALAGYKAAIATQGSYLTGAAGEGEIPETVYPMFELSVRQETSQATIFSTLATADRKNDVRDALTSDARTLFETTRDGAIFTGSLELEPKAVAEATTAVLNDMHDVETDLMSEVIDRARTNRLNSERAARFFGYAAVIATLVAAAGAVLLGRRITRPLNKLTHAAHTLSTEHMPRLVDSLRNPNEDDVTVHLENMETIDVDSKDEIGMLASSFNEVQRVAQEVAAEQAALLRKGMGEMFVNLSRRNQSLLDRQIEFIDELERSEENPDQLENLYRLDHLATRMRRNAESLLVLAGAEPTRRRGRPAPLANVVRAALAEVEDFARIELLSFDEVLIASNVAADIAHLLSELMENATNFSPPETRVEVVGHRTKADGYVISVSDHGIGMSAEQLEEANATLAKPPLVGLALSRSLGFIVVGRLAKRHGVTVRMTSSPSGGVTAVVSVPSSLLTDAAGAPIAPPVEATPPAAEPSLTVVPDAPVDASAPIAFAPEQHATVDEGPGIEVLGEAEAEAEPEQPAPPAVGANGLPTRRMAAGPAPGTLPTRQAEPAEPETEPEPEPVEAQAGPAADVEATEAEPEPVPEHVLPEAIEFSAPVETDGEEEARPVHLDTAPPPAPTLPTRGPGPRRPAEPAAKPFFLEESEPPRLFGRETKAPEPTPVVEPEPAPAAPAATVAAPSANGSNGTAPLLRREPAGAATAEQSVTTSGLAKRVPRAAGASRAIPGADVERGVSATRRSPEEVRNLLSRYRAGAQRGRSEETVPADSPEERDTNE